LGTVVVVGTLGFVLIENAPLLDSFFMTMITISTVGYSEVFPLSQTGELFTVGLIVVGVGTLFYTAGAALEAAFENLSGRRGLTRMTRTIERLTDHHIICGFGRVGSATWELMEGRGASILVVEGDPIAAQEAREAGALVLENDATHNETLVEAGIEKARSLIACVTADSDNLVIVLSAKALCPDLLVIARAAESESERKLYLAGADRVVAPQRVGAHRLASMAFQPELADFVDLVLQGNHVEFRVQQMQIHEDCVLAGMSLREAAIRQRSGAMILAVEDESRRLYLNPDPDLIITPGQVMVGIGTNDQIEKLTMLMTGAG
ncbi:MAG: potassium channel protein, partial [Acidimicrobiia bacterium]|nr:potassium channel protein [Acidimicrobiia bacterium]